MTTTSHSSASRRPRSSPIAILRPGDEATKRRTSLVVDSDDDDDIFIEGGVAALSLGTYVGSVPTKPRGIRRRPNADLSKSLPGAPMLASRSFEMRQGSLPPISLTENVDSSNNNGDELPSYGSLRESHLEGKFLDGPSSYRDHSGQIHALRHNQAVRLDDFATSYQAPATLTGGLLPPQNSTAKVDGMADWSRLTPGERLMAASSENNNNKTTPTTTTSTLSSMMMQGNLPPQAKTTSIRHDTTRASLGDAAAAADDDGMLSTSLTGLEILQSARGRPLLSTAPASMPSFLPNSGGGGGGRIPLPPPVTIDQPDDDDEEDLFELDME